GFIPLNGDFTFNENFDPATVDAIFDYRRRNLGVVRQNGVDFSANYGVPAAGGTLQLTLDVAYINEIRKQVTATSEAFDVLDTYANPTHLRARLGLSFMRGGWS